MDQRPSERTKVRLKTSASREIALELLNLVTFEDAYANLALPKLLQKSNLSARDRAFTQELAFGTIRLQLTYDAVIDSVSTRQSTEIDAKLLNCLRLGVHQLLSMRVADHAAISETVELVRKHCGEKVVGFANGVLRSVSRKDLSQWLAEIKGKSTPEDFQAIQYSHPKWIIDAFRSTLEADGLSHQLELLLIVNNKPADVNLVALPGLAKRPTESENFTHNKFSRFGFSISNGNPTDVSNFDKGYVRVQDEGSQLAALALAGFREVGAKESWLDLCAGPGGKAALLASVAKINNVTFQANELSEHRARLVADALNPVGSFTVSQQDGREIGSKAPNAFDRILVDAPCTGLGALRRRPEARWRKSNQDLKELCKLQFELLESAISALKPGGLCLYVTCSPHLSETTAIIHKAIQTMPVEVLDLTTFMNKQYFHGALPTNRKTVQLFTQRDGTDSMFLAMLTKR